METGNHNNSVLFCLEEYSVGEWPQSRSSPLFMDHRKPQGILRNGFDCVFNCQCESEAEVRMYVLIPSQRLSEVGLRVR